MFDFLFKRRRADIAPTPIPIARTAREQDRQVQRAQALMQVAALRDEAGALPFLLRCEFADARLQAAQWIQSAQALGVALPALRNSDRRVAKLLQTRLDQLQRQQRMQQQMQAVIVQAQRLLQEPQLTPSQAAALDHDWTLAVDGVDSSAAEGAQFILLQDAIAQRLVQQADLQRRLIDVRLQAQQWLASATASYGAVDAAAAQLAQWQQHLRAARGASEVAALPLQLLPECAALLQQCEVRLEHALEHAQSSTAVAPQDVVTTPVLPDVLLSDAERALQLQRWQQTLEQLEQALEQGALQAAIEAERQLRSFDASLSSAAAQARLDHAHAALQHLQGWAKWGGNISREELLLAALALPEQALPVAELAQKIGSLRARWKLLAVSAGTAPQALWQDFDGACTLAYAPAAAQFALQDQQRGQARTAAQALIDDVATQQHALDHAVAIDAMPDWKQLTQFEMRVRQAWQQLPPLGHKDRRQLERVFYAVLNTLLAPLRLRQESAMATRHTLISAVCALLPQDRQTPESLRQIQAQWQQVSQALPLARKDEQALWQRFRSACDAVFVERKAVVVEQDAQRQAHLQHKQALCAQLEQALTQPDDEAAATLRQVASAWHASGPVPRAAERSVEQRYAAAADALQRALQTRQAHAAAAAAARHSVSLGERLVLCFALEARLAESALSALDLLAWRTRWQADMPLPPAYQTVLTQRFENGLSAGGERNAESNAERTAYLLAMQQQRGRFDDALLEAEIASAVASPPQWMRQRMQMQVALLQSALQSGVAAADRQQSLLQLCALPALADAQTLTRVSALLQ